MAPFLGNFTGILAATSAFFHGFKHRVHTAIDKVTVDPLNGTDSNNLVVLYPLWAHRVDSQWQAKIHGVVLQPRTRQDPPSWWQSAAWGLAGQLWGSKKEDEARIQSRMKYIFSKPGGAVPINSIAVATKTIAPRWLKLDNVYSGADGTFDIANMPILEPGAGAPGDSVGFAVRVNNTEKPHVSRVQLVGDEGFSVISDVDDTVRDTRVLARSEALRRTIAEEFAAVAGMPELFRHLQTKLAVRTDPSKSAESLLGRIKQISHPKRDVAFFFLTGSPFDILPPINKFFEQEKFPNNSLLPNPGRFEDIRHYWNLDLRKYKSNGTDFIVRAFPKRRYILIGDSGQEDPEAYADVVRDEMARRKVSGDSSDIRNLFQCVLIRLVTGQNAEIEAVKNTEQRFRDAFLGLPYDQWRIFSDPKELMAVPFHEGKCYSSGEENAWRKRIVAWEAEQARLQAAIVATRGEELRLTQAKEQARTDSRNAKRRRKQMERQLQKL